jgi:hypothetical protein
VIGGGGSLGPAIDGGGDPRTSGGAAPRWATDGGAPPRTSEDDAPEASRQAVTVRPKRMSGEGAWQRRLREAREASAAAAAAAMRDAGRSGGRGRGRLWRWRPHKAWVALASFHN